MAHPHPYPHAGPKPKPQPRPQPLRPTREAAAQHTRTLSPCSASAPPYPRLRTAALCSRPIRSPSQTEAILQPRAAAAGVLPLSLTLALMPTREPNPRQAAAQQPAAAAAADLFPSPNIFPTNLLSAQLFGKGKEFTGYKTRNAGPSEKDIAPDEKPDYSDTSKYEPSKEIDLSSFYEEPASPGEAKEAARAKEAKAAKAAKEAQEKEARQQESPRSSYLTMYLTTTWLR